MKIHKFQPTLGLKPTQFSVGIVEVEYKVANMRRMKPKKLQKLIRDTPIPVVLSPWNELCVVDHHHFLFACWHAHVRKVRVELIEDFSKSKLTYVQFWRRMAKMKFAYLVDQFGEGPRNPLYLPDDIRGLADDPYRSLAWVIRKEGGYEKADVSFSEFKWADFFRSRNLLNRQGRMGLKDAVHRGIKLARSKAAKNLPGYIDKNKIELQGKIKSKKYKGKTQYVPESQKTGELATLPVVGKEIMKNFKQRTKKEALKQST